MPTVIVPPGRMPSVDSGVVVVRTTDPVPVAGVAEVLLLVVPELEVELVLELELELELEPCKTCSTIEVIWLSTRSRACPLAIPASPLPRFVSALAIALITEVLAESDWLSDLAWLQ